jgi:uncharacterized protein YjdB
MRALSSIPVLVSVLLIGTACNGPTGPGDGISTDQTRLTLIPSATTIVAGGKVQLHFTARDQNGLGTTPSRIIWATSDPRVAAVAPDGLVTGLATGTSQITALWGGVNAQSTVTVVNGIVQAIPCSSGGAEKTRFSTENTEHPLFNIKKVACTAQ